MRMGRARSFSLLWDDYGEFSPRRSKSEVSAASDARRYAGVAFSY